MSRDPLAPIVELLSAQRFDQAADHLATVLATQIELRLDAQPLLDQLPESELERHPVLLRAAGLNEQEEGRQIEAVDYLDRAQQGLVEGERTWLDIELDRAMVARERQDWVQSDSILTRLEARDLDIDQRLRLINLRAVEAMLNQCDFDLAAKRFEEVEAIAMREGKRSAYLTAVINRGLGTERVRGRFDRMMTCAAEIERNYGGRVPVEDQVYVLRLRAEAAFALGQAAADDLLAELVALGKAQNLPQATGYGLALQAIRSAEAGQVEEARRLAAASTSQSLPTTPVVAFAGMAEARCSALQGKPEVAARLCREAAAQLAKHDRAPLPLIEGAHGQLLCDREGEALGFALEAIDIAARLGAHYEWVRASVLKCNVEFRRSEAERVVDAIHESDYVDGLTARHPAFTQVFLARCLEAGIQPERTREWVRRAGTSALIVRAWGPLTVVNGSGVVTREQWIRPKARVLFAYLLVAMPNPIEIEQAIEDLWPDSDPDDARNALRVAASYVRKVVGPDCIEIQDRMITMKLPSPSWVDIHALKRAARTSNPEVWRRALAEVNDGAPIADIVDLWVFQVREDLQELKDTLQARLEAVTE